MIWLGDYHGKKIAGKMILFYLLSSDTFTLSQIAGCEAGAQAERDRQNFMKT